jgi:NAD(P)-dependent dehydrogenase (short-subunit alcohol dehydrogenase family)
VSVLQGKTALVTGGTTGIGLAAAQRMAIEGAHVFLTGRRQETVDVAVASIGSMATGVRSDITDPEDLDALVAAITAHGCGLDVLFANAGGSLGRGLPRLRPKQLHDRGGTVR